MTLFWILTAALILAALFFALFPLLMKQTKSDDTDTRTKENIAAYNERLTELNATLATGGLTQAEYHEFELELQRNLLDDESAAVELTDLEYRKPSAKLLVKLIHLLKNSSKKGVLWIFVLLFVPSLTLVIYFKLGASHELAIAQDVRSIQQGGGEQTVDMMVARLKSKLEQSPDNVDGWFLLARTYLSMGRYEDAAKTYENILTLSDNDSGVMGQYAQALYFAAGQQVTAEVQLWMNNTLKLNPNDVTVLGMKGIVAFEKKDYQSAANIWQQILDVLPEDHSERSAIAAGIAEARRRLGGDSVVSNSAENNSVPVVADVDSEMTSSSVVVNVSLDKGLTEKVLPTDTLFILAKAVSGPPIPLAVVRKTVADLPLQVTLSDKDAMMQGMSLSSAGEYQVIARVSKSGRPIPSAGDLQGSSQEALASGNAHRVSIVVDSVLD